MRRYLELFLVTLVIIVVVGGYVNFVDRQLGDSWVRYDGEQVCKQHHPELPLDQCLTMINFAQSAGM